MSYAEFIRKWTHPDYTPQPVVLGDLERVEAKFGVRLPTSYKTALTTHGAASTNIVLLDTIVDKGLEFADVQEFATPLGIVEQTEGWRGAGLPTDCIAFASDCMGNLFCFRGGEAVWFWDHDFGEIEEVAPSFDSWIAVYCALEPIEGADDDED